MSNVEQARALFFEALDFLDASDFQAAEARLRQALQLSPDNPAILTNLSVAFTKASYRERITHLTEELDFLSEDDKEWIMGRAILDCLGWK